MNEYEEALLGVGKIVEPYAMNNQFAVFGFGGIPRYMGSNSVSHCFNLNGQPNPIMSGITHIYNQYKFVIKNTGLAGPTYFGPVLQALLAYV